MIYVHWLGRVISLRICMGDLYRCSVVLFFCDFSHWIYYDLGPGAPSWVSSDPVTCWHMSIPVCYISVPDVYMHNWYINMACSKGYVRDKRLTQIIDLIHKSCDAPVPYPTMHHSEQICVFWMVHCGMSQVHCGICETILLWLTHWSINNAIFEPMLTQIYVVMWHQ